ncbi:MAG: site-2 protease family protein [Kiritimatiellia bacterium]
MLEVISDIVYRAVVLVVFFGLTIFIHEFGHFLTAVAAGMVVDVFSIGFGPAIWKKKRKGITYKIGCIPFGGYVALPQLDPAGMSGIQGKEPSVDDENSGKRSLPPVSPWKKIAVSLAGAGGNVLLGIVLAWAIFLGPPVNTNLDAPFIGNVAADSRAHESGLRPGDRITRVNGREIDSWYRLREECVLGAGDTSIVEITVLRDGTGITARVPLEGEGINVAVPGIVKAVPCVVSEIPEEESGETALNEGDLITALDGQKVVSCAHLDFLSSDREGESAVLTVERDGEPADVEVVLPVQHTEPAVAPILDEILPGKSADKAGLRRWDRIVSFDGVPVASWQHFSRLVAASEGKQVPLAVERHGRLVRLQVTPEYDAEAERLLIGVRLGNRPTAPWMRHRNPWAQVKSDALMIFRVLKALLTPGEAGQAAKSVSGPPMIFLLLWFSLQQSIMNGIGFIRFININLAVLNLLPIPVLDGGHIVFALWEGITRRRANPTVVNILVNFFMVLLLAVILLITFRDFVRIFSGFAAGKRKENTEQVREPSTVTNRASEADE